MLIKSLYNMADNYLCHTHTHTNKQTHTHTHTHSSNLFCNKFFNLTSEIQKHFPTIFNQNAFGAPKDFLRKKEEDGILF